MGMIGTSTLHISFACSLCCLSVAQVTFSMSRLCGEMLFNALSQRRRNKRDPSVVVHVSKHDRSDTMHDAHGRCHVAPARSLRRCLVDATRFLVMLVCVMHDL